MILKTVLDLTGEGDTNNLLLEWSIMNNKTFLYIRRLSDNGEDRRIEIKNNNSFSVDNLIRNILRNLNTDEYYVDDSEI